MTSVAVLGASGYAGGELLRLVHNHPELELVVAAAGSNAGAAIAEVHPQFASVPELGNRVLTATSAGDLRDVDLVFTALPHGQSAALIAQLSPQHKVVDLGADFRLRSAADWNHFYGGPHAGSWTYGLSEANSSAIAQSTRVANPGCYATAIALGYLPALSLIDSTDLVVVAASGTSGAGRAAKVNLLGSEVMGSMTAYKVGGVHQHTPEIEQTLADAGATSARLSFTPMLAPMSRGILATLTARTTVGAAELRAAISAFYATSPFVHLLAEGIWPTTAATLGSNHVHIQATVDERTQRAVIVVALDNLVKGAAGQAVQNANLMLGLAPTSGLTQIGVAP